MNENPYTIRPAEPGDADALSVIGTATFLDTYAGMIPGAAIINQCRDGHAAAAYAEYMADGAQLWIAHEAKGAPVGYAMVTDPDIPGMQMGDAELRRIYVQSRFHGSGLAQMLLRCALDALIDRRRLLVGFNQDNARARAFYTKSGFVTIGTRRFEIGGHMFDDDVFAVELPSGHSRERGTPDFTLHPATPASRVRRNDGILMTDQPND